MKNQCNILILEDKQSHFENIESILSQCNYFPSTDKEKKIIPDNSYLNDYAYVKAEFKKLQATNENQKKTDDEKNVDKIKRDNFFEKLYKRFGNETIHYDYFIIDLELKDGTHDNLGKDFMDFLEENLYNLDSKTIILSNSSSPPPVVVDDIFELRYNFIQKSGEWLEKLTQYLDLSSNTPIDKKKTKSITKDDKIRSAIDKCFHILFLFIILVCVCLILKNIIWYDLNVSSLFNSNEILDNSSKTSLSIDNQLDIIALDSKSNDKVLDLLKFAEHIFLYLIPLFIVFGFYSYYYFDFRRILLKLPNSIDDSINARNTISVTKTLFLSSILSYTIIKTIEIIYLSEGSFELEKVVFLVLLMGYLLISHKSSSIHK